MKRRSAKSLFKGAKAFRLLHLPPDAVYYDDGDYFEPPAVAARPALTQVAPAPAAPASVALGNAAAVKQSFLDKALAAYELSYKELAANWRGLEVKAQGTITVAGIFIAAAFAFLQKIQPELRLLEKVVLGATLFFLVMSVLLAVRVLVVRSVPAPVFGELLAGYATGLYQESEGADFPEAALGRYEACFEEWQKVIDATQRLIKDKAGQLAQAQGFLQVAIVAAAILAAARVVV